MLLVDNRQEEINVEEKLISLIEKIIDYALVQEEVKEDYEVSLLLVNNNEIKDINREQRGKDMVTDVLSFPMLDYEIGTVYKDNYKEYKFHESDLDDGRLVLGDIVLNLQRAEEQRIEYQHSFNREVCYLIIHSVLHLLGYDHIDEEDKHRMREREEYILNKFNLSRVF